MLKARNKCIHAADSSPRAKQPGRAHPPPQTHPRQHLHLHSPSHTLSSTIQPMITPNQTRALSSTAPPIPAVAPLSTTSNTTICHPFTDEQLASMHAQLCERRPLLICSLPGATHQCWGAPIHLLRLPTDSHITPHPATAPNHPPNGLSQRRDPTLLSSQPPTPLPHKCPNQTGYPSRPSLQRPSPPCPSQPPDCQARGASTNRVPYS